MDQSSGTNGNDQSQSGGAAGQQAGAGADGGAGAPGGQQQGQGAQDQSLSRENAKWRTQVREQEKQISQLTQQLEELKTQKPAAGSEDASEVAQLKRQLGELQKSMTQERELRTKAEEARKQEKLDNALLKVVSDAKLLDPEDAMIIARTKGRARVAEDGKPVFVITENGEEREVLITADALKQHKLVPERFFPAEGAPGSGSKGGTRGGAPAGLDYERGLRDQAYFAANKDAMLAETKRRNSL
jgi:hypothetical protein